MKISYKYYTVVNGQGAQTEFNTIHEIKAYVQVVEFMLERILSMLDVGCENYEFDTIACYREGFTYRYNISYTTLLNELIITFTLISVEKR